MISVGAVLAAIAVLAGLLGARRGSAIARRLAVVAPSERVAHRRWQGMSETDLRRAGFSLGAERFLAVRVAFAVGASLVAAIVTLIGPVGPAIVAVAGSVAFLIPALVVDRRASANRVAAERQVALLVERLEALVAAGRPPETALVLLLRRTTGVTLLDRVLHRCADAYDLGAPIFRTLAAHARTEGLVTCAIVADELDRARDLGAGSLSVIRERRTSLRAAERAEMVAAASQVEGKLMLVLVLCYLPALIVLVVIPLFVGLLDGLFA